MRFNFRQFVTRPALYENNWLKHQPERKVTWTELFFDLFVVPATTNVTHFLTAHPDATGAGQFMLSYTIFFLVWLSHAVFTTRTRLEGLLFDFLDLIYHLGVIGMVVAAQQFTWYARLAGSFVVVRLVTIIQHIIVGSTIPEAGVYSTLITILYGIITALALVAAFLSQEAFVGIFTAICVLEGLATLLPVLVPKARVPIHVEHTAERLGLIMMIFLGESIVGFGIHPLANNAYQYAGIALSTVCIWSLHLMYYHANPEQHDHALRQTLLRGTLCIYGHWLLGAALLVTGVGLRLVLNSYPGHSDGQHVKEHSSIANWTDGTVESNVAWILCGGYGASLHVLGLIRAAHY
eukprot:jgi/Chrzof1/7040/Cz02g08160.t1